MTRFHAGPALVAALSLAPALAEASGFSFGENGVKSLSMGGAFTGQADDLTAIQQNPAGLQQLSGFHFLVDGELLNADVSFSRTDARSPPTPVNAATNSGGPFALPFVSVGYGTELAGRPFTVALGAYGPPAIGHFQYPQPDLSSNTGGVTYVNDPRKYAPQRYSLISSNTLLFYPTLSAAYSFHPRFSAGVSLQYVFADIKFNQDVTSVPFPGTNLNGNEDPHWDSLVATHFTSQPTVTGIFGLMARPVDRLQLGASLRPPIVINASGTLDITLGSFPKTFATVSGDSANLEFVLPMEIRFGAHFEPLPDVGVNADVIYEGWHRLQNFAVTPTNITTKALGQPAQPLAPFNIVKNWHDTVGFRLGGSYRFGFGLSTRAGVLFEQAAAPDATTNIDFPHLTRVMLTAGVGYPFGPIEVLATGVWIPTSSVTVTNSQVVQTNTNAGVPGDVVGNGTYSSGGWIAGLGIRGKFGGSQ